MAGVTRRIKLLQEEFAAVGPVRPDAPVNLQGLTSHRSENEAHHAGECIVVFPQSAYRCVVEHLSKDVSREHGGFLLGYETWSEEAKAPVVVVEHAIPASHTSGTPVRLTFTKESWRELDAVTEKLSKNGHLVTRVGWYHSHPDLNIFLSHWDLDVCKEFDRRQNPIALVVDPVKRRGGFFVRAKDGYRPQQAEGFLERHDLQESSIVDWVNLKHEAAKPIAISGPDAATATLDAEKLERQIREIAALLRQSRSANRRLSVFMILLLLLLSGGTWYAVNRRIDGVNADLGQTIANLRIEVEELGKVVADLEGKTAGQNPPDVGGSSQKPDSQGSNKSTPPGPDKSKQPDAEHSNKKAVNQKTNSKDLKAKDAKSSASPGSGGKKGATTAQKGSDSSATQGGQSKNATSASDGTTKQADAATPQAATDDKPAAKTNNAAGDAKTGNEPKTGDSGEKPPDTSPKQDNTTQGQDSPPGSR